MTMRIIDRAVRLATHRLPRSEQNRIRELCLEVTRESNPGEASRIATEIANRESEAWLEQNRQCEAERAEQVSAGAAAFAKQMEALVGEDEPEPADEPSQPAYTSPKELCRELAYEEEVHKAIRKVLDRHKGQGGHFPRHDYEDLEQTARIAVLDTTRRCERNGKEMTGALAFGAARNAAVKLVLECTKHTNPTLYGRGGRLVKNGVGKRKRGAAISTDSKVIDRGGKARPLQDVDPAFCDTSLSPERYASNEEVRTIILTVAESLHGLKRQIAQAMIDADFDFNVAEFCRTNAVAQRTGYRAYRAVNDAFRAVLKDKGEKT